MEESYQIWKKVTCRALPALTMWSSPPSVLISSLNHDPVLSVVMDSRDSLAIDDAWYIMTTNKVSLTDHEGHVILLENMCQGTEMWLN